MHAAGQSVRELRQHRYTFSRVPNAEHDDAVPAVRCALATDHRDVAILGNLDVVDRSRVDLHLVEPDDLCRVGHVPDVRVAVSPPRSGDRIVTSVGALPDP